MLRRHHHALYITDAREFFLSRNVIAAKFPRQHNQLSFSLFISLFLVSSLTFLSCFFFEFHFLFRRLVILGTLPNHLPSSICFLSMHLSDCYHRSRLACRRWRASTKPRDGGRPCPPRRSHGPRAKRLCARRPFSVSASSCVKS